MQKLLIFTTGMLLAIGVVHAAEVYRWVDNNGKVHYSDMPPPPSAKDAELKKLGKSSIDFDKMSYAARDAAKKNPVTLYANNCGAPCDDARQLLSKRGIPFATKNPESSPADADALKKLVGAVEVPVLVVGSNSPVKGFEAGSWSAALDAAGYPKTALITPDSKAKAPPSPAANKPAPAPAPAETQPPAAESGGTPPAKP
ncbi:MAG TPA: glutaredoxin family protein [Burkholderiales bacterium]|nr:glutaredoxin family protein [Burkholderiales bacterium]